MKEEISYTPAVLRHSCSHRASDRSLCLPHTAGGAVGSLQVQGMSSVLVVTWGGGDSPALRARWPDTQ